jgi:hypothetical protein
LGGLCIESTPKLSGKSLQKAKICLGLEKKNSEGGIDSTTVENSRYEIINQL